MKKEDFLRFMTCKEKGKGGIGEVIKSRKYHGKEERRNEEGGRKK